MPKTRRVAITMSELEHDYLKMRARRKGMSLSEYVRQGLIYSDTPLDEKNYGLIALPSEEQEAKSDNIRIKISPEDKEAIRTKADMLGTSMSNYIRQAALTGDTRVVDLDLTPLRDTWRELVKQGVNLNQLAYYANRTQGNDLDAREISAVLNKVSAVAGRADELLEKLENEYKAKTTKEED